MPSGRMVVSTMLTGAERCRVDAAGTDAYEVVHRDSIDEVVGDVRACRARAVLVSVACCQSPNVARIEGRIASIVRDFPRVTTMALLSEATSAAPTAMLLLGRSGVRTVVDARRPEGWRVLRETLAERLTTGTDIVATAVTQLSADLRDAPGDCRRFFFALFSAAETIVRVDQLAQLLGVLPSTLISRFARGRLPSPTIYLSWARLVRAAALLEDRGVSLSATVGRLEYSSPQAFSRHLRLRLGIGVSAFRRQYSGSVMLERFRRDLVTEQMIRLRDFRPLDGSGPADRAGRGRAAAPGARDDGASRASQLSGSG